MTADMFWALVGIIVGSFSLVNGIVMAASEIAIATMLKRSHKLLTSVLYAGFGLAMILTVFQFY